MASPKLSPPAREERVPWLDAARALAILSVTCNHAFILAYPAMRNMKDYYQAASLPISGAAALFFVFSRLGVPLFLMISGALLLDRDYTKPGALKRFYTHNWLRLLLVTELWNVLIYLVFPLIYGFFGPRPGLRALLTNLGKAMLFLNADDVGSRWYMAMIRYCVTLPFHRVLSTYVFRYFLILWAAGFFGSLLVVWLTGKLPLVGKWLYLMRPRKKD